MALWLPTEPEAWPNACRFRPLRRWRRAGADPCQRSVAWTDSRGVFEISRVDGSSWSEVTVSGRCFQRRAIHTRWLNQSDDLTATLLEYTADREPHDTIVVSEKVALLLTGRTIPVTDIRVGPDARLLTRFIRPRQGSMGLKVPVKMQWVTDTVGRPRVYLAALTSALTRPFGVKGVFYRVAGDPARSIDGARPPYTDLLFPPFDPDVARALCQELETKLDNGVAIADINDYGGSVRAVSPRALPADTLLQVLADNPMRQRSSAMPFVLVRAT